MQNLEQVWMIFDNPPVITQTGEFLFKILQSPIPGNDFQSKLFPGNIPYQINFTETAASAELQNGKSMKFFAAFQHLSVSRSIARNSFMLEYACCRSVSSETSSGESSSCSCITSLRSVFVHRLHTAYTLLVLS